MLLGYVVAAVASYLQLAVSDSDPRSSQYDSDVSEDRENLTANTRMKFVCEISVSTGSPKKGSIAEEGTIHVLTVDRFEDMSHLLL